MCGGAAHKSTTVGTAAVQVPASALSGKRWMYVRVSPESPVSTAKVKCRMDGANPVMGAGNPGDVMAVGDGALYAFAPAGSSQDPGTPQLRCISDTAGTIVTTTECLRAY